MWISRRDFEALERRVKKLEDRPIDMVFLENDTPHSEPSGSWTCYNGLMGIFNNGHSYTVIDVVYRLAHIAGLRHRPGTPTAIVQVKPEAK